jgi:inorganic pyrophosphatase
MLDAGLTDDKVLAVPATDPLYFLAEVAHFFQVYKDLEMVGIEALGWDSVVAAKE